MQMCAAILKWNSKGEKHLSFAYTEEGLVTFLLWTLPRKVDTQFWSFFLRGIFILKTFTFQIEIQHSSGWNQNVCVLHKYHQKLLFFVHILDLFHQKSSYTERLGGHYLTIQTLSTVLGYVVAFTKPSFRYGKSIRIWKNIVCFIFLF